jgi:hypothetical protein
MLLVFGGSLLLTLGAVAACTTDNGTTPIPTRGDSGSPKDSGKKIDSGDPDDQDLEDEDGGDGGVDCTKAPKPRESDGVYCRKGSEGSNDAGYCVDSICCSDQDGGDGKYAPGKCVTPEQDTEGYKTGACNFPENSGGREWHCTESKHCPNTDEICCVAKGSGGNPSALTDKEWPGCGVYQNSDTGKFISGTRCRSECETGELQLCSSDADCKTGKCKFFELANRFTGVCK